MISITTRERLLASSMICGVALAGLSATHAAAQTAPASGEVSEIVVTGSRIPQPNLTSVSPLSVVNDQEVKFQGATQIETVLQNLPSVTPTFNQGVDNGATGTATVALRGLGPTRTLVLVDGNRLMPGDPAVPVADLNNIPTALVDRVEVVTGGASAVYGSDAVAGVVNFIMKKNFEGLRLDSTYSFAVHDNNNSGDRREIEAFNAAAPAANRIRLPDNQIDAKVWDVTAVLGVNAPDGRGNITAYASYRKINPLSQDRRDVSACADGTRPDANGVFSNRGCLGSSNSGFGHFGTPSGVFADNPDGTNTFVPFTGALSFNFNPYNFFQQDDTRYTAGYFGHYEVSKLFDVYSNLMFADDRSVSQLAPSGLFTNSGSVYRINCANPLMSASQRAAICGAATTGLSDPLTIGYRFVSVPRVNEFRHTAYTIALGTRGALNDDWSYDIHGQIGRTNFSNVFTGDLSIARINDALNVVPGATGPVCASGNAGCVPLDIFHALSTGISRGALDYVLDSGFRNGSTEERVVSANVTGRLPQLKSPLASDGLAVAFGSEYRSERVNLQVSRNFGTGDLSGSGGASPPAAGGFDVYELFGEARLPLVQDLPFVKELGLELGYRYSDYNLAGQTDAYKISGDWQITSDIRIRGGFNRAVRAPNVVELFAPQTVGLVGFNDPCSGASPAAHCDRTFATSADATRLLGNVPECAAAQCSQLTGGNLALKPEEADTYTIGFVATPRFLPGFNLTVDYYDIKINDPITPGIGAALIFSQCLSSGAFCNLIHRDPTSGALFGLTKDNGYVINTSLNSGSIKTSGVDYAINYRREIGAWGGLAFNMVGSWTREFRTEPVSGLGSYDCAGFYGPVCNSPSPKWKSHARLTWTTPVDGLQVSGAWRHMSSVKLDLNSTDPFKTGGDGFVDTAEGKIKSFDYFDLAANYRFRDVSFRIGMNNVFDKDPPQIDTNFLGLSSPSNFGNGNTFPGVYDAIGRTVFVGVTADF